MTDAPPFEAPWQAEAFALTLRLHERGVFDWPSWSRILGEEIARDPAAAYWASWVAALERILAEAGIADAHAIDAAAAGARHHHETEHT